MPLSNAQYPSVLLMASAKFMIALAILVTQIIRHRMAILHPATLIVRMFFSLCLVFVFAARGEHLRAAARSTNA